MKHLTILLISVFASSAFAVEPGMYRLVSGGVIAPSLTLEFANDDNPERATDGSEAAALLRVRPQVTFSVSRRNNELGISYAGDYNLYSDLEDTGYQDHTLVANGKVEVNRRLRLGGSLDLAALNSPRGTNGRSADGVSAYRRTTFSLTAAYGAAGARGEVRAGLAVNNLDYDDGNSDSDERQTTPSLSLFYRVGSRTRVFGGFSNQLVRGGNQERDVRAVFAGLELDGSDITSGSIRLIDVNQDFLANQPSQGYTGWDISLVWKPRTFSVFTISGGRQTERGLFISNDLGISSTFGVDWNHSWSSRFSTNLSVDWLSSEQTRTSGNLQEQVADGNDVNRNIRLTGAYNLRRWLDVGLFVQSEQRNNSAEVFREYDRTVVGVTLSGTI